MPEPPGPRLPTWRWVLSLTALLLSTVLLAHQLQRLAAADIIHPKDFVQYWAAGQLNLNGQNPYDRQAIFALEKQVGKDTID